AGVFDGSQLRVYLDGLQDGAKASIFAPTEGTSNLEVWIRGVYAFVFPFNGLIDEVRISSGAIYTANFGTQGCLTAGAQTRGLWKFDGQTAADSSGNNNTGTLQGGATYSTIVPTCGPAPTPTPTPTPTPGGTPSPTPTPTPTPSGLNSLLLNGSTSYMNVVAPGASSLNLTG